MIVFRNFWKWCRFVSTGNKLGKKSLFKPFQTTNFRLLTHYQTTNFRFFDFADDNLKFEENGRKLFKHIENTVGKGEIARDEQFLLFHSVFKRLVSQRRQKVSLCGNGLIPN